MLMSELAARTGVPVPTIKYYLREGLLMPGRATSATRAEYGESHIKRIALVKALSGHGLSLAKIKTIVGLIDAPEESLLTALGAATSALPPSPEPGTDTELPRARAAFAALGRPLPADLPADLPAAAQLEQALADAEAAGLPMTDDRLRAYAPHITAIAAYEIDRMPLDSPAAAIEYAVLGTVLYEPILAALRRITHAELTAQRLADQLEAPRAT
ncbi:MerR family transcriptional regulator [Nocardia cyriacigeorgica]|uniref:Putative transcriptional regulator, MerR family n=1 Tax=Nocardia cyriacigeorgica (strain GUH-2) TaxID=1127134 RepID=H6R4C7_NOCCG|nr:MerR family transcriptional regulator [Nocardia cyriacigeorgica]MBF6289020.1 MerR family transcriptional regulator [Nocardia cyriacigeorgica]CCF61996.1 putative transcriptional regulator, MerR family [Nocardia cyriacigeorgica GUH-2]